jgi:hypothetical protein
MCSRYKTRPKKKEVAGCKHTAKHWLPQIHDGNWPTSASAQPLAAVPLKQYQYRLPSLGQGVWLAHTSTLP